MEDEELENEENNNESVNLKDLLYDAFLSCKEIPTDENFCNQFINAIETFFESGHVYTIDSGTVGSSPYVGVGVSYYIKGDTSSAISSLLSVVKLLSAMTVGGEVVLANGISSALNLLFLNSQILCLNSAGNMSGNLTFDITSSLGTLLTADFIEINQLEGETPEQYNERLKIGTKYKDTDECLCDKIANHIQGILENPLLSIVNTSGTGTTQSVVGVGSWQLEEKEEDEESEEETEIQLFLNKE